MPLRDGLRGHFFVTNVFCKDTASSRGKRIKCFPEVGAEPTCRFLGLRPLENVVCSGQTSAALPLPCPCPAPAQPLLESGAFRKVHRELPAGIKGSPGSSSEQSLSSSRADACRVRRRPGDGMFWRCGGRLEQEPWRRRPRFPQSPGGYGARREPSRAPAAESRGCWEPALGTETPSGRKAAEARASQKLLSQGERNPETPAIF